MVVKCQGNNYSMHINIHTNTQTHWHHAVVLAYFRASMNNSLHSWTHSCTIFLLLFGLICTFPLKKFVHDEIWPNKKVYRNFPSNFSKHALTTSRGTRRTHPKIQHTRNAYHDRESRARLIPLVLLTVKQKTRAQQTTEYQLVYTQHKIFVCQIIEINF